MELVWLLVIVGTFLLLTISYACVSFILYPLFKTNKILDNLLKDTLHELNIPISTIDANVKMLAHNADNNTLKRLTRIKKASESLERLYKEVDYYIKKEISAVKSEVFDIQEIVYELSEQLGSINSHISLMLELKPLMVKADKIGFYKVLSNLLVNAYKYNKKDGFIKVTIGEDFICVEDGGIGMSEESRFKIFDIYYQANPNAKGYGLGLHIVKDYCDKHKIFINLHSVEGEGTTIKLNLKNIIHS